MCPQKWYASASPGFTSALVPAIAITPAPTRARNPRREVEAASPSTAWPSRSGTERSTAALGGGEHRLELRAGVERPLRQHRPVGPHRDGERAAGHVGQRPGVGVLDLVEAQQLDGGMAAES